jgi:hypothetical protein
MVELELERVPGDRRTYELDGIGRLRLEGWASRRATLEAHGRTLSARRRGVLRATVEATDPAGTVVGTFAPAGHGLRRGGTLAWATTELALRPASAWRERYALADGDRELALFEAKGWGKRPVRVSLEDAGGVDALLVLFCAFVAHALAEDASAAPSAATGAG